MSVPKGKLLREKLLRQNKKTVRPFRLSLRYKLAFPVLILVSALLLMLFQTTFRTVRAVVFERNESRLQAIAEVFAETIKVPLILGNQQVLLANIEWMSKRTDVSEVRVEDAEGTIVGGEQGAKNASFSSSVVAGNFLGVKRVSQDTYAVAVPIRAHDRHLGRVLILFSQKGFENELRDIFEQRLMVAFIMALFLAALIAGVTWIAIRPLFILKQTAQQILLGDLTARAHVYSFDEIHDLGDAFNEMVGRLAKSLDNLRSRTEALEESEEKYRLIVENASDIILTLSPEGEISLLNRDISGATREELFAEGVALLLSLHEEESKKKFEEELAKVCASKRPATNLPVTHLHRESQTEIFYLINLTPVVGHDGNVKLIQCVMRDVTELRRIEIMKESLIRDVAHELRTPTAKFEMAVEWFEKEISKSGQVEKYSQVINILRNNTDRLMRTITSIMDLSKLESGMDKITKTELDLNEVVSQVRQDLEPICKKKGLSLECFLWRDSLRMMGDRDMLYRLFVNLITNAVKFTEKGKISMTSRKVEDRILVTVTDTGSGIEPEYLERVFERFFQKTASSMGIGVGLTISRDIAVLHDGKIWAESEGLGKGASFQVEFPGV